jgi:hypothetical protein
VASRTDTTEIIRLLSCFAGTDLTQTLGRIEGAVRGVTAGGLRRFILGGSRARRWWGYLSSKAGWYISETKSNFLVAALTLTVNFWIWSCSYQLGCTKSADSRHDRRNSMIITFLFRKRPRYKSRMQSVPLNRL